MTKKVYVGASLLNEGAQLQNKKVKKKIEKAGLSPYLPQDDKSINDKANAVQEGLAERIVKKDFGAIDMADVHLFDVLETTGTTTEIGYVFGQKRLAKEVLDAVEAMEGLSDNVNENLASHIKAIKVGLQAIVDKPFIATCSDVRRANKNPQEGDRREWSINQLLYGVVLELTDGKGFTEIEDLRKELKKHK